MNSPFEYRAVSLKEIDLRWQKDINDNIKDTRWVGWKDANILDNTTGAAKILRFCIPAARLEQAL